MQCGAGNTERERSLNGANCLGTRRDPIVNVHTGSLLIRLTAQQNERGEYRDHRSHNFLSHSSTPTLKTSRKSPEGLGIVTVHGGKLDGRKGRHGAIVVKMRKNSENLDREILRTKFRKLMLPVAKKRVAKN